MKTMALIVGMLVLSGCATPGEYRYGSPPTNAEIFYKDASDPDRITAIFEYQYWERTRREALALELERLGMTP